MEQASQYASEANVQEKAQGASWGWFTVGCVLIVAAIWYYFTNWSVNERQLALYKLVMAGHVKLSPTLTLPDLIAARVAVARSALISTGTGLVGFTVAVVASMGHMRTPRFKVRGGASPLTVALVLNGFIVLIVAWVYMRT